MAPIISQEMVYYIRHTEEEQAELRKWKEELEHSIVPCDKSLDEFIFEVFVATQSVEQ